jgi:PTH2 family peptidyl-tRNA hydrolase
MASKQVLVMRKFPKLRTGKYCAQAAHASLGAILGMGRVVDGNLIIPLTNPFVYEWITGRFTKVTLYVETDQELISIYESAVAAGLPAALIEDAGLTEFGGKHTLTAVGIGPDNSEEIDKITGKLPLF